MKRDKKIEKKFYEQLKTVFPEITISFEYKKHFCRVTCLLDELKSPHYHYCQGKLKADYAIHLIDALEQQIKFLDGEK